MIRNSKEVQKQYITKSQKSAAYCTSSVLLSTHIALVAHKDNIFLSIFPSFTFRLVGGAGDIKLTKDGNTLLKEMVQIKHQNNSLF